VVSLVVAVVSGVLSFVSGALLTRHRARVDAQQTYQLQARQRLYAAVGPLRFQLVVACRELASRIENLHRYGYGTQLGGYFGQSTLYRLLRPLTLAELIERQTNYVDFGVDPAARVLLRFQAAAYRALTGGSVFAGLTLDWDTESQHVVKGRLQHAANLLITDEPPRCARFDEFPEILEAARHDDPQGGMARLAGLLEDLTEGRAPVFWCRLVAYGYVANWLVGTEGAAAGFTAVHYPVADMLRHAHDDELDEIAEDMSQRLDEMIENTPGGTTAATRPRRMSAVGGAGLRR
jgi:hypothetical protein